ncbi:unnamed protein product [Umbelopsis vinacea]
MLDETARKRESLELQNQHYKRDYASYVKSVDLSYDGSTMVLDKYKIIRLATHCVNLETLNIRNSHDLRDDWLMEILKSHTHELSFVNGSKLQVMDMSGFTVVRQLVAACSTSLESLAIIWRYRLSIESVFASASINQILQDVPKLKKLSLDCQTGESLEVYQFPDTLLELQLYCLCSPATAAAVGGLKNMKRLFFNYTFLPQETVQRVLEANGNTIEALGYNEGSGRPLTRALLEPCTNLQSLQTTLAPGIHLGNVVTELYRHRLEHLSNKWEGHTYLPSAFRPIDGLWSLLTANPWPRIRSLDIVNAVVTKEDLHRLPTAFPNIEYLGFIVSLEQDLSPDEWISYFSLFPYLKGIGLRQDLRLPYHISEFWNGRYLRRLQSAYQDWSMNEQHSTENNSPIRNPFDTWPQTLILHTISQDKQSKAPSGCGVTVALLSRARKLRAETSPSLALNMDSTFGGGLDENPWAPTATPTEVDILKMKPESPTLEHIHKT